MTILNSNKFTAVFIDTNYYVKDKFNFNPSLFNTLKNFMQPSQPDSIKFLATTITRKEMIRHLKSQLKQDQLEINKALKEIKRKIKIKSTSSYYLDLYKNQQDALNSKDVDFKEIDSISETIIDNFLSDMNAEIIDIKSVSTEEVFNLYFEQKAPFSLKKSNEFPDAFTLLALIQQQEDILFLSEDNDFYDFFSNGEYDGMGIVKTHIDLIEVLNYQSIFDTDNNPDSLENKFLSFSENIISNGNLKTDIISIVSEYICDNADLFLTYSDPAPFILGDNSLSIDIKESDILIPKNIRYLSMHKNTLTIRIDRISVNYTAHYEYNIYGYSHIDHSIDYVSTEYSNLKNNNAIINVVFSLELPYELNKIQLENKEIIPRTIEQLPIKNLLVDYEKNEKKILTLNT